MGAFISRAILKGEVENLKLSAVAEILPISEKLSQAFKAHGVSLRDSFEALAEFPLNLVIECANQAVAKECIPFFINRGLDVVVMSTGVFVDPDFHDTVWRLAKERDVKVYVKDSYDGKNSGKRA